MYRARTSDKSCTISLGLLGVTSSLLDRPIACYVSWLLRERTCLNLPQKFFDRGQKLDVAATGALGQVVAEHAKIHVTAV